MLVSPHQNSNLDIAYLVNIVGINTVTSFFGCRLDPLLHDFFDVLLALLIVNINIPFVPLAKSILKGFGTGAHAVFVDWNTFTAIAIWVERQFISPTRQTHS